MSLDPNKTYLTWSGAEFPNSSNAQFKAPAGSSIDWGDGTVETFETASETVNTHTYTDGLTEHTIAISGLTSIDWKAFYKCNGLKSIKISDGVTIISGGSFAYCDNLANIHIPDGVTTIGTSAFNSCSKLTSVEIPDSVASIGNGGFYGCNNLKSVTIGNSINSIGNSVFGGCTSLQYIILFAETPPRLGSNAIPSNVQSIYVTQSSKAAYQAATNWNTFASKIVSDNLYLSFIRFNQKNKDYIDEKVSDSAVKTKNEVAVELQKISDKADEAESIAKGRATGYVFDTKADMDAWLENPENVSNLVLGDNLYIRATDVPDYWWDGSAAQMLETQKVDLTGYLKKETSSGSLRVYAVNTNGSQTTLNVSQSRNAYSIPRYNAGGQLEGSIPNADYQVANKKYVDDSIAAAITTALNTEV